MFGTGSSAERAWKVVEKMPGLRIVGVADNDDERHGDSWQGFPVKPVADIVRKDNWDFIVIASSWHTEICAQLIDVGVPSERIAVFEPWGESGLVAGVKRWKDLFPNDSARDEGAIMGFEEDYEVLKSLLSCGISPRVVLDVGASSGPWSVTCARVFPEAAFYLVEPLPHYEGNLLTEKAAGWHRLSMALGSEDGEITISIPESQYGPFGASALGPSSKAVESRRVPLRSIDSLLTDGTIEMPQLVKLDVQGFEAEVLAGGEQLWGNVKAFVVELSLDRFWKEAKVLHEMVALFANRGYYPFEFFHQFRGADGLLKQIDCVFLLGRDGADQNGSLFDFKSRRPE